MNVEMDELSLLVDQGGGRWAVEREAEEWYMSQRFIDMLAVDSSDKRGRHAIELLGI